MHLSTQDQAAIVLSYRQAKQDGIIKFDGIEQEYKERYEYSGYCDHLVVLQLAMILDSGQFKGISDAELEHKINS